MNRPRRLIALLLLATLCPVATVSADERHDAVDALFERWDRPDSPGCALGVMREGLLIYQRGYGMASLEHSIPISSRSVFRTGSVGKQFTAMAVLLAEAAGKLSLSDDIRKYLPELAGIEEPITIAQLMHHSSGLRDYLDLMYLAGFREEAHYNNEQVMEVLARQRTLNFGPGSDYLYSNSGYFLLSQIIERATGKTLREWSEQVMFAPLGMNSTHFHDDPWMVVPKRAYGYSRIDETEAFRVNMTTLEMVGDGGVFTTIEDLAAWERNFIGPTVGGPEVLARRVATGTLADGTEQFYAAGLSVREHRGLPVVHHGGSFVGFRAATLRFPEQRFGVYVICNVSEVNPLGLAYEVADIYLAGRLEAEEDAAPKIASGKELDRLVGTYADRRRVKMLEVTLEEGKLVVRFEDEPWSVGESEDGSGGLVLFQGPARLDLEVEESTDGSGARLRIVRGGRRAEVFQPQARVELSPEELGAYIGEYESEELAVIWSVVRSADGKLLLRLPPLDDSPLEPLYRDAFNWDWGHAVFERGRDGAITGMRMGTERGRGMWMKRVTSTSSRAD